MTFARKRCTKGCTEIAPNAPWLLLYVKAPAIWLLLYVKAHTFSKMTHFNGYELLFDKSYITSNTLKHTCALGSLRQRPFPNISDRTPFLFSHESIPACVCAFCPKASAKLYSTGRKANATKDSRWAALATFCTTRKALPRESGSADCRIAIASLLTRVPRS